MALTVELLDVDVHDRNVFYNRDHDICKFLKERANKEHKLNISDTYVLVVDDVRTAILGYFTLSLNSVLLSTLPQTLAKKLPKYKSFGTVLLGRMGRDENLTEKGFGSFVLRGAMVESLKRGSFYALEVNAKNDKLSDYYKTFGFIPFLDDKQHLHLPRTQIERTLQ
jgi:hypothetical protein